MHLMTKICILNPTINGYGAVDGAAPSLRSRVRALGTLHFMYHMWMVLPPVLINMLVLFTYLQSLLTY